MQPALRHSELALSFCSFQGFRRDLDAKSRAIKNKLTTKGVRTDYGKDFAPKSHKTSIICITSRRIGRLCNRRCVTPNIWRDYALFRGFRRDLGEVCGRACAVLKAGGVATDFMPVSAGKSREIALNFVLPRYNWRLCNRRYVALNTH